jgi:hypothetical protein
MVQYIFTKLPPITDLGKMVAHIPIRSPAVLSIGRGDYLDVAIPTIARFCGLNSDGTSGNPQDACHDQEKGKNR